MTSVVESKLKATGADDFREAIRLAGLNDKPYRLRYSLDRKRPHLFLLHPMPDSDKTDPAVEECNGLILAKDTFQRVAQGMNLLQDGRHLIDATAEDLAGLTLEEAEDGTVVRAFHDGQAWTLSTNRRIDASRARWASNKTFLELFSEALPDPDDVQSVLDALNPLYTYSFVLVHPENQHVLFYPQPAIISVSRRHVETGVEESPDSYDIPWASLPSSLSVEDYIEQWKMLKGDPASGGMGNNKRGVIISDRSDATRVRRWKIDYPWFENLSRLRKNKPTMHLSYLACSPQERLWMKQVYPCDGIYFVIDNAIIHFAQMCYNMYRDAFIRRQYTVDQDDPMYQVMRRLHRLHKSTGRTITFPITYEVVNTIPAEELDLHLRFLQPAPII